MSSLLISIDATVCNATNTQQIENDNFFNSDGTITWDAHRIGWLVAGIMTVVTIIITTVNIILHTMNYYRPLEQRQIIRILLLPPVYATISFFSYRFFRDYTYYFLAESIYEALAVAAFLMLLINYVGESTEERKAILAEKEKKKIPFPFCCWRFRPSKPYFMHTLKWAVLQYCLFRPLISLAGVITEAYNVLCPEQYSIHFAEVYLDSFDFVSFSIALYALIVFYALTRENLKGRAPLAKFLSIKLIVFFTFYQGFVFSVLQSHNVIKGSQFWTSTNVANGLQALCTCVEMVVFSALMMWSFSSAPYRAMRGDKPHTNSFMAFLNSMNYWDFIKDTYMAVKFFVRYAMGKPGTHSKGDVPNFDTAFGVDGYNNLPNQYSINQPQTGERVSGYPSAENGANHIVEIRGNEVTLNGKRVPPVGSGRY
ncbi:DUF300-domain-containing protein [Athelia psychrophila]|uniref:DUF300-domain-containing protein n=1 Tax=Athelia psychrophila TaxID=1759441 RepID=A0A165ZE87_9AGAM|nr:DUF300-domain-containing protein [Fibularhizoctonia sp. CBS 109695]